MQTIIQFDNVSFTYPGKKTPALDGINLSVTRGEFLAVMGENGAGKTTLCHLINGIIPHSTEGRLLGTVTVDGEDTKKTTVARLARIAGTVLDDPDAHLFTPTVRHEAAFGPENLRMPRDEIEKRVGYSLKATGLAGFEKRIPSALSGGEKQRLAIASSLAMAGKILVLDDPLSRLDPQGAEEVMKVLRDLREKLQLAVVMATHNSGIAKIYADRICVLNKGRIAACGKADIILADNALLESNGIAPLKNINAHRLARITTDYKNKNLEIRENPCESVDKKNLGYKDELDIPAIKISNFCYSYSQDISIENINLSISDNDFAAIAGSNGCGKTTLLKSIAGLLRPLSGEVFIRGKNTKNFSVSEISKEAGFVMQNPNIQLFTDSVYNEIAFALKNAGLPKTEIKKRAQDALDFVGLNDPHAFPHALSRRDRAKTVLACVIAMGCKILMLDEIDTGLDYKSGREIMNILKELNQNGYTVIFVSHNIPLALEYARGFIMMDRKGIIENET